ncbi:MAG: F0F1 ATP synthase subunit B, partial [Cytophagales bacterium]|nr:F0F1 ATP synthase subunit B [Cytophagales bacterium]
MELIKPGLGLIFWMTVTFSIVLFLLTKFAWKPILKALKEREDSIDSALSAAKKAKEEMEQLQSNNQRLLDEARGERDKMMREAQETAQAIVQRAKEVASEEGA